MGAHLFCMQRIPFNLTMQTSKNPEIIVAIVLPYIQEFTQNYHFNLFQMPKTNIPTRVNNSSVIESKVCDINVPLLMHHLEGYCEYRRRFLYLGLMHGFKLHYRGPRISKCFNNHKSALNRPNEVENKLQNEVQKGHIEGPFYLPPFDPFIISPIGLVPKKETGKFRMIHDLSYPKNEGTSVNAFIPRSYCTVQYEDFDVVADLIVKNGPGCFVGKIDIESAFRIIPIHPSDYWLLGMKYGDKIYFDKRLPMGASISCSTFEELSRSIQWILVNITA